MFHNRHRSSNFLKAALLIFSISTNVIHSQVIGFNFEKLRSYHQSISDSNPTIPKQFSVDISLVASSEGDSTMVNISTGTSTFPMTQDGAQWKFHKSYSTAAELESDFPSSSTYTISVYGGSLGNIDHGFESPSAIYPDIPLLAGSSLEQSLHWDPTSDFSLNFNSSNGSHPSLHVHELPFMKGQALLDVSGPPGSTSPLTIPAGTVSGGSLIYGIIELSETSTLPGSANFPSIDFSHGSQVAFRLHPEVGSELAISSAKASGLTGRNALPSATPFDDQIPNILKFACNMPLSKPGFHTIDPDSGTSGLPNLRYIPSPTGPKLDTSFLRRKSSGLDYRIQVSNALSDSSFEESAGTELITPIDSNWDRVRFNQLTPSGSPQEFSRLEVKSLEGDIVFTPPSLQCKALSGLPLEQSILFLGDSLLETQVYELGRQIPNYTPLLGRGGWQYPPVGGAPEFDRTIWPTKYSNSFTHRILGPGQSVFIARSTVGATTCNEVTVYYVKEAGAGTFDIQIGPTGGPFETVATIDADNGGARAGGVARIPLPTMRTIAINCVHQSGGYVRVLAGNFRIRGISGMQTFYMVDGGSDVDQWSVWDPAIAGPILRDLAPDLVYFQVADSHTAPNKLPGHLDTLYELTQSPFDDPANKPAWLVLPRNPWLGEGSDLWQSGQAAWLRNWAAESSQMFIDIQPAYGTGELADYEGLVIPGGNVHPTVKGHTAESHYVLCRLLFIQ